MRSNHLEEDKHVPEKYDSLLIISDTHVGLPDKEIFREDFESFITFLATVANIQIEAAEGSFQIERPRAIILLGDFLDLWDGRLSELPSFSANFARLLTNIADVFYLRGNHDYIVPEIPAKFVTSNKFEICEHKLMEVGGRKFFFIHGHQFMSAFGPISLRIESYMNPFYTMMEGFLSRFTKGHGKDVLGLLTVFWGVLCLFFLFGYSSISSLSSQAIQSLWLIFGLLFPVGFVTAWRVGQKRLWKFFTMIFGEIIGFLRGAARGDTIEYLTSTSKPIARWFKSDQSEQAKQAGTVVFGHTHIPEGPMRGSSEPLRGIIFLNTGSWMRPPTRDKFDVSERARRYTRFFDRFDEYVLILLAAITSVAMLGVTILLLPILIADLVMVPFETLVLLGKSSHRRLPNAGLRSLAFIGKDAK